MPQDATQAVLTEFKRTTDEMFSLDEFRSRLESGQRLRIKYGVDVTAPTLHIGHAVNLWMMRYLQDLGHRVVFLIGDSTTRIGDPTGKSQTRPTVSADEIEANAAEFLEQVSAVLKTDDPQTFEVRRNSEWWGKMPADQLLSLLSMVTHARLISRDMFRKRMASGADIYMHELVYPLLQGYDSYALEADLTIIGTDQLFNEMLGRFYQERLGQKPQVIVTTKITPGIDGREKQSKSLGNYVGLAHSARDKFGRLMRVPDDLVGDYLRVYSAVPMDEIASWERELSENPLELKKRMARAVVARYHGYDVAQEELEWFDSVFSQREVPEDIPELRLEATGSPLVDVVRAALADGTSSSAARRLIEQGGVRLNDEQIKDIGLVLIPSDGDVLRVGRRRWFRIRV